MREMPKLTPKTIKQVNNLSLPNLLEHQEIKREIKTICITGTLQTNHPYTKFLLSEAKELKTCEQRFFTTFKMTRVLAVSLPLAPTGGVILCSVILTVGKDLKTAAKYL